MVSVPFLRVAHERPCVRISGKDARAYLQTKLTINANRWLATGGAYGFATDINGKLLFDADYRAWEGAWLAAFGTPVAEAAIAHLDKYVIREDVVFEDVSSRWVVVEVHGQAGLDTLVAHGFPAFDAAERPMQKAAVGDTTVWAAWRTWAGHDGALLLVPRSDLDAVVATLTSWSLPAIDETTWLSWNVLQAQPLVGRDLIVGETIPLEAGGTWGVDFNKGCYLGQEIIERLHSRGNPAKRMIQLRIFGAAPEPGATLTLEGDEVGWVMSSTADPANGQGVALAWLRRKALEATSGLLVAGVPVVSWSLVDG
jgi:folate-binding protein YgfZ